MIRFSAFEHFNLLWYLLALGPVAGRGRRPEFAPELLCDGYRTIRRRH